MFLRIGSPRKKLAIKITTILIVITIFLSGCGLSIQVNDGIQEPVPLEITGDPSELDRITTIFTVKVPYLLVNEESIAVDIVDEVNGLSNIIQRHIMTRIDDFHYEVTISNLLGSVVKYRYVKIGAVEQSEITAIGTSVKYRMTYINSDYRVEDIIAGWPDTPFMGLTGEVSGVITSSFDSKPIADTLICVGGYQTFTDNLGRFEINNIPIGSQKLTTYSIDGNFQTFQHSANIMENLITSAQIQMIKLPEVNVTFVVSTPGDAIGAPIKMAGSFLQLGNTFGELRGGESLLSARMPLMTKLEDGRYTITLRLHGGNDLRYIYTLGDSKWNSEQKLKEGDVVRQVIVPNHDIIVEETIETWRQNGSEPFVIEVTAPPDTPLNDTVSIQFKITEWSEPIPMWAMSNNQWLFLLFSPLPDPDNIYFRFCRNDQCDLSSDENSEVAPFVLSPNASPQNSIMLSKWKNWNPINSPTTVVAEVIEKRSTDFITGVEFDPGYHPTQQSRFPFAVQELANIGTNTIILTPTWQVNMSNDLPNIEFHPGSNIFMNDLTDLIEITNHFKMEVILYPFLDFNTTNEAWWQNASQDALWWNEWYKEYTNFIISYAQLAENLGIKRLIIGDPSIVPSLPGGLTPDDSHSGTPANAMDIWQEILVDINEIFTGELIWSLSFQDLSKDYLPLLEQCDSIYMLFDPPLNSDTATDDLHLLEESVSGFLDNDIEPYVNNLNKPIYLGISYASADGAGKNCITTDDKSCISGPLFTSRIYNIPLSVLDLQEQVDIYNVISKAIIEREWIDGFISRGFYPSLKLTYPSSSINGKPAMDVLWYWFSSIK